MISTLASGTAPVPTNKPANFPKWWFQREVIPRLNPNNSAPLWANHDYPATDDYTAANVGQLKQIATQAAAEMNAYLPGGAGSAINSLVAQWGVAPAQGATRDDYAVLNLGQLKTVAQLFYTRLIAVHYTNVYPWAGKTADDFSVANIGQLKFLFSFDLTLDSDGDGIPDWWEAANGLNPHDPSDAGLIPLGGPFTNLQKYLLALNPLLDSDGDGIPDLVEIANGTNPWKKDAPVVGLQVSGFTVP